MRFSFLLILSFFFSTTIFSQMQGGAGSRNGGNAAASMTGRMYGKLVDSKTNKGIDAASVQMIQSKFDTVTRKRNDIIIAGMLTRANGEFNLESLPLFGNFKLKITAIGYKAIDQKVAFEMKMGKSGGMEQALSSTDKDLGNIKMEGDAQTLETVTVTGSKPLLQMGIDRKVFNVDKSLTSVGGTAVDVMRNVPSLMVDIDGNVTMRNNSPTIFVDGRPTTLTLDQIPAENIQSVELITNPSAKFDASGGTSGILNIVLKKNRKAGYNGSVRAGIDSRARVNAGADINIREGKVNVFASANLRQFKSISEGETRRQTFLNNPNTDLYQKDNNKSLGGFGFGRFGVDYFMNNRNTLSLSGNFSKANFKSENSSDIFVDTLYSGGKISGYSNRFSNSNFNSKNYGYSVSYKHNYPKAGQELTADLNYNKRINDNVNNVLTNIYSNTNTLKRSSNQRIDGGGNNDVITIQTDYVDPLTDKSKLELGARASIRNFDSYNNLGLITSGGVYIPQRLLSSQYKYTDKVYAAYGNFSSTYKNWGYQLGLRAESSEYNGELVKASATNLKDTTEKFSNSFPLSLFPSMFLSYKIKENEDFQVNYTRRVNRPNFFQLFPFTDYSDSLNLRKGNPGLKPEFTNSIEVSYQKTYKNNNNFLGSVYFKHTDKLITSIFEQQKNPITGDTVLISTYTNANTSFIGGVELTYKMNVTKWWELNTNVNLFTSKINIDDPSVIEQDQLYSWFGKLSNNFKLPKNITIQLTGDYTSKTILPPGGSGGGGFGGGGRGGGMGGMFGGTQSTGQGYIRPSYGVDFGVRYDFMKNKVASLSLNVNDIFRTRISNIHSESTAFTQDVMRRRDPQVFRLNFSWRFGKFDTQLLKRKNMKGERESMQNMSDGM